MAGAGPLTAAELARRTGTAERYVREWLEVLAAGDLTLGAQCASGKTGWQGRQGGRLGGRRNRRDGVKPPAAAGKGGPGDTPTRPERRIGGDGLSPPPGAGNSGPLAARMREIGLGRPERPGPLSCSFCLVKGPPARRRTRVRKKTGRKETPRGSSPRGGRGQRVCDGRASPARARRCLVDRRDRPPGGLADVRILRG